MTSTLIDRPDDLRRVPHTVAELPAEDIVMLASGTP